MAAKYTTPPRENTSLAGPAWPWAWACSGDMNDGVPSTLPAEVSTVPSIALAMPKSITRGPSGQQHVAAKSRCTMPGGVDVAQRLGQPGRQPQPGGAPHRPVPGTSPPAVAGPATYSVASQVPSSSGPASTTGVATRR